MRKCRDAALGLDLYLRAETIATTKRAACVAALNILSDPENCSKNY